MRELILKAIEKNSRIDIHEVGTMDAVADVVCVCLLLEDLKPDVIMARR